jgi:hypothetical protein
VTAVRAGAIGFVRKTTSFEALVEAGRRLRISEKTVKSHVSTILGKFGLESHTQAALHAARMELVSTQPTPDDTAVVAHPAHRSFGGARHRSFVGSGCYGFPPMRAA